MIKNTCVNKDSKAMVCSIVDDKNILITLSAPAFSNGVNDIS